MDELSKLQRTNAELSYLINKIDEEFGVIAGEFAYLESLIRQSKDLISC